MTATAQHYTAWITTDASALPHGNIDVTVMADEITGYTGANEQTPVWGSTGDQVFYAETDVDAGEGDRVNLLDKVEKILTDAGYSVGTWDGVDTGYVATVTHS
ncbi:MAG: hypothetical protein ACRDSS_05255 [Actinocrinis sp.]